MSSILIKRTQGLEFVEPIQCADDEVCYWLMLNRLRSIVELKNLSSDPRFRDFFRATECGAGMLFDKLPDNMLRQLVDVLIDIASDGFLSENIEWSDLGGWGLSFRKPSLEQERILEERFPDFVLNCAMWIDEELYFRANYRKLLSPKVRIVKILAQSIRDKMEEQVGWSVYGDVKSWLNENIGDEFEKLFADYRQPGRVERLY